MVTITGVNDAPKLATLAGNVVIEAECHFCFRSR
jgi:hypothetical protein